MLTYYIVTDLYYLVIMTLFPVIKQEFGGTHHIYW